MSEAAGYVQLFIYKVPRKNHDSMGRLLYDIAEMLKRNGTIHSEFYQLYSPEAFQGFTSILKTFSNNPDEELWVELDHYCDRAHRDHAMAEIGKDETPGPLFRRLAGLVSQGYSIVIGELNSLKM